MSLYATCRCGVPEGQEGAHRTDCPLYGVITMSGPVCRGSWALGTACRRCERCIATRPMTALTTPPSTPQRQEYDGEAVREAAEHYTVAMDRRPKEIGGVKVGPGLYRIHWKDGGSSLAAIGMCRNGAWWVAPTNWTEPAVAFRIDEDPEGRWSWADVKALDRLDPAALAHPAQATPSASPENEPVAYMRRWAFDGDEGTPGNRPRGWKLHAVTQTKALPDDVPLFATASAVSGDAGEGAMSKRTLVLCVSGKGPTPHLEVHFANLADAHAAHNELLGIKEEAADAR